MPRNPLRLMTPGLLGWLLGCLFHWLPLAPTSALALTETSACEIRVAHLTLDDGATLEYSQAGQGPPVVLLHGLFASKEQWQAFQCAVAAAHARKHPEQVRTLAFVGGPL